MDTAALTGLLVRVSREQGRLLGKMDALGFGLRDEARLRTLTQEVIKSSDIEGETLDNDQVRSSNARRLGMDVGRLVLSDQGEVWIVELILDATGRHDRPLTQQPLLKWHKALFPSGGGLLTTVAAGKSRDDRSGPMQVVSGAIGRQKVHYEAPRAK